MLKMWGTTGTPGSHAQAKFMHDFNYMYTKLLPSVSCIHSDSWLCASKKLPRHMHILQFHCKLKAANCNVTECLQQADITQSSVSIAYLVHCSTPIWSSEKKGKILKKVPGLGGAFFALNWSGDSLVSFSRTRLNNSDGFSLVYLLLSKEYHLAGCKSNKLIRYKNYGQGTKEIVCVCLNFI